jgi:hypothetical protein
MVAKASWLTVEPKINLATYLAGEEPRFFSSDQPSWLAQEPTAKHNDFEMRHVREDKPEKE